MNNLDIYMTQDIYAYLNICDKIKVELDDTDGMTNIKEIIYYGCKKNIIEMINYCVGYVEKYNSFLSPYWSEGFRIACKEGNFAIAGMMIGKGGHLDYALYYACSNADNSVVETLIKQGATHCACGKFMTDHLKK